MDVAHEGVVVSRVMLVSYDKATSCLFFQGLPVTMEDAEELRAAIIGANNDMAQPLFLKEQLLESTRVNGMEPEVGASLLQMLSQHNDAGGVRL
jgi:hypothetical protein